MPARPSDERLVAAFRDGDEAAFQQIHDRYRPPLLRFAARILRNDSGADDVVQEALWRAHRALRRDDRPMQLRPWLYRLVRNCCLDEIGRVRTDTVDVHAIDAGWALPAPARDEPPAVVQRRADLRQLLDDVALLPPKQRHALLRRELDGLSHRQLAVELDITPAAARVLVHRARTGLVKAVEERSTACHVVRADMVEAHDARRRGSAMTYRHLARCAECREFRTALRSGRRAMAVLMPGPLVLLAAGGTGLKLAVAGKASAGKAAVGATTATLAIGAAGLALPTLGPGDPAPSRMSSPALPGGRLDAGDPLPAGTAIVRRAVQLRAGTVAPPSVTLLCPGDLRVADLLAPSGARLTATYGPEVIVGASSAARIVFEQKLIAHDIRASVAILCKRPGLGGSIVAGGAAAAAVHPSVVRLTSTYLRAMPAGRGVIGSVRLNQPVRIIDRARAGSWVRIVTDTGQDGWVATSTVATRP